MIWNNFVGIVQLQNGDAWLANKNIKDQQHSDEDLKHVIQRLESGNIPTKIRKQGSRICKPLESEKRFDVAKWNHVS